MSLATAIQQPIKLQLLVLVDTSSGLSGLMLALTQNSYCIGEHEHRSGPVNVANEIFRELVGDADNIEEEDAELWWHWSWHCCQWEGLLTLLNSSLITLAKMSLSWKANEGARCWHRPLWGWRH